jgi:hypothetical protein
MGEVFKKAFISTAIAMGIIFVMVAVMVIGEGISRLF